MRGDFARSEKEVFLRAWWFASALLQYVRESRASLNETGLAYLRASGMVDEEKERGANEELLAYASEAALQHLQVDIESAHGWTEESYDLHRDYLGYLGIALDEVTGAKGTFGDLLEQYWDPYSDEVFEELWSASDELSTDASSDADRYYVFRVGRIYRVADADKLVAVAQPYRDVAVRLYSAAFVERPVAELEAELAEHLADGQYGN